MKLFKLLFIGLCVAPALSYADCSADGVIMELGVSGSGSSVYVYTEKTFDTGNPDKPKKARGLNISIKNNQLIDTVIKARLANKPIKMTVKGNCEVYDGYPDSDVSIVGFRDLDTGDYLLDKVSDISIMEDYYPQNN